MIDVDAGNGRNRRQVPVVDLERNQADEEIILVGEKRKKSNRSNSKSEYISIIKQSLMNFFNFYMINFIYFYEKLTLFLLIGCSNKKRKINLDDDTSVCIFGKYLANNKPNNSQVDPLHLFEEKEREFQRIRRNFPTTNPLIFLPFDIIEHVCYYLNLRDFVHLLCVRTLTKVYGQINNMNSK